MYIYIYIMMAANNPRTNNGPRTSNHCRTGNRSSRSPAVDVAPCEVFVKINTTSIQNDRSCLW